MMVSVLECMVLTDGPFHVAEAPPVIPGTASSGMMSHLLISLSQPKA